MIGEDKVQAVVLGCTELPLLFEGVKLKVSFIDVVQVHINELIKIIIEN